MRIFSFTKTDRLLKHKEFVELSKKGKKVHNRHFVAFFSPNRYKKSRLGVTVFKKVGCAATRNRIKRLTREYFRLNRSDITGIMDINVIPKKGAAELSSDQYFSSLHNIFSKISGSHEE